MGRDGGARAAPHQGAEELWCEAGQAAPNLQAHPEAALRREKRLSLAGVAAEKSSVGARGPRPSALPLPRPEALARGCPPPSGRWGRAWHARCGGTRAGPCAAAGRWPELQPPGKSPGPDCAGERRQGAWEQSCARASYLPCLERSWLLCD